MKQLVRFWNEEVFIGPWSCRVVMTVDSKSEGHEATASEKAMVRRTQSKQGPGCQHHPFKSGRAALAVCWHQAKQSWKKTYMSITTVWAVLHWVSLFKFIDCLHLWKISHWGCKSLLSYFELVFSHEENMTDQLMYKTLHIQRRVYCLEIYSSASCAPFSPFTVGIWRAQCSAGVYEMQLLSFFLPVSQYNYDVSTT